MSEAEIQEAKKLADAHWAWLEEYLTAMLPASKDTELLPKLKKTYVDAFGHGFKHGVEYERNKTKG